MQRRQVAFFTQQKLGETSTPTVIGMQDRMNQWLNMHPEICPISVSISETETDLKAALLYEDQTRA